MGSSAAAAAAAAAAADSAQWLSVKEETIFLHDGLIRVTDLAELPSEILGAPEAADTDLEVSEVAPPPGLRRQPVSPAPPGSGSLPPARRLRELPGQVCVGARRAGGGPAGLQPVLLPPSLLASSGPPGISSVVSFGTIRHPAFY